jgi:hypothetical protein
VFGAQGLDGLGEARGIGVGFRCSRVLVAEVRAAGGHSNLMHESSTQERFTIRLPKTMGHNYRTITVFAAFVINRPAHDHSPGPDSFQVWELGSTFRVLLSNSNRSSKCDVE